jgi:hypothetical protein
VILFLALGLTLLEWRVCLSNMDSAFNGFGALRATLRKTNMAPMRYRPLMAWLIGWLPIKARLGGYLTLKAILLGATLLWAQGVYGTAAALVLGILIATTIEFDYWEQYVELLGVMACLHGGYWGAAVGAFLWGLSKETALFAPALTWSSGNELAGVAGWVGWAITRLIQGKAELYCERWTWKAYNWPDLKSAVKRLDAAPWWAVVWTIGGILAIARGTDPARWCALLWLISGWTMARARETRLLLPVALWIVQI